MSIIVVLALSGSLITVFLAFLAWRRWMCRWIWGGRAGWEVIYFHDSTEDMGDELQRILIKDNGRFWRSSAPQSKDAYLRVKIKKSGFLKRGRVIDAIRFDADSGNEIPELASIRFYRVRGNNWRYARKELIATHKIITEEFSPIKIDGFGIRINTINRDDNGRPYHWTIYNFRLREVKLFGRWIRRWI